MGVGDEAGTHELPERGHEVEHREENERELKPRLSSNGIDVCMV